MAGHVVDRARRPQPAASTCPEFDTTAAPKNTAKLRLRNTDLCSGRRGGCCRCRHAADPLAANSTQPSAASSLRSGAKLPARSIMCRSADYRRDWCHRLETRARPRRDGGSPMGLQQLLDDLLGADIPIAVECYDGSRVGPIDAPATVRIVRPEAIQRIVAGRGRELAFARAYIAGEIDIEGDIYAVIGLRDTRCSAEGDAVDAAQRGRAGRRHQCSQPAAHARTRATSRRGAPARSSARQGTRRRRDLVALRRLESLLRDLPRPLDDLLVRALRARGRFPRSSAMGEVRLDLSQTRASRGQAPARHRVRLGRHGVARGAQLWRAGGGGHDLARAVRVRPQTRGRCRPQRSGRDPVGGLSRCTRRSLRRDQLHRHVRTCRRAPAGDVYEPGDAPAWPRGAVS